MTNDDNHFEELTVIDEEKGETLVKVAPFDNDKDEERIESDEEIASSKKSDKRMKFRNLIILVMIISLIGGSSIGAGFGLMSYYLKDKNASGSYFLDSEVLQTMQTVTHTPEQDISVIVKNLGSSVVAITSTITVNDWFYNSYETEGQGSGVIFNISEESVLIVTNNHVVDNANELVVELDAELYVPATIVGSDPESDLSVIKIDRSELTDEQLSLIHPVVFGDSDTLQVGETAIAIGNPLGYGDTVTVGVISALNRELQTSTGTQKFIQTDAAINPGNSGGALVNGKGECIGINSAKIADTDIEGFGFAIPSNAVKPIIQELLEKGYISRPYLGISGKDVTEDLSDLYEIPMGVVVVEVVSGSGAEKAGLRRGDIIILVDDEKIYSMDTLVQMIESREVGDQLNLKVIRDGEEKLELTAKLQDKNNQ
jgi:serine protease Do